MSTLRSRSRYRGHDRRRSKPTASALAVCAALSIAIAFATLCPPHLRPHLASAEVERFGAYFALGLMLASAAPRRWVETTTFVILLAVGLEFGQLFVQGRDADVRDALTKALGGLIGLNVGWAYFPLQRWIQRRGRERALVSQPIWNVIHTEEA